MPSFEFYGLQELYKKAQSNKQWTDKLTRFFGQPYVTLGTTTKSKDQCVGFVAAEIFGEDEFANSRMTITDEKFYEINYSYQPRREDQLPYLFIKTGIANIPMKWIREFISTPEGDMLSEFIFSYILNTPNENKIFSAGDTNAI